MARKPRHEIRPAVPEIPSYPPAQPDSPAPARREVVWIGLAVAGLLAVHLALAERSLITENPTVDEVVHMPAGITYWQKHTFRLYHHNPPLIKLIAALPVVMSNPVMDPLYQMKSWTDREPSQTTFSQTFAFVNAPRYFELFQLARMVMPLFSVLGGLIVFAWSSRLYGPYGGLLSLCLWVFCPNILAHTRLVTTDVGSTVLGVGATYLFWRYLRRPNLPWAIVAGLALGLAQLSKFSMLLLYFVWPFLWVVRTIMVASPDGWPRRVGRGVVHGLIIVALSILTIDVGYLFEGVGKPLGSFEFASQSLTSPVPGGVRRSPATTNPLYDIIWPFAQNRFRGTILEHVPAPLPEHYLLGFDEQKIESEGIPIRFSKAKRALAGGDLATARAEAASTDRSVTGYSVYLNGELRRSGWWYYYLATLAYKMPEGTWLLALASLAALAVGRRSREGWADEVALGTIPIVILFAMSFLTDINLGLRYVIAVFPYIYIQAGKVVPWVEGLSGRARAGGRAAVLGALALTVGSTLASHPHYLAYFNWASGGPDRVPARLIDSNLDWGQDLVGLREWCRTHIPDERIGLALFGQINPSIFTVRGDHFDWFLPPVKPADVSPMFETPGLHVIGPSPKLTPGYYAVSATMLYGLSWRLYDNTAYWQEAWQPSWNAEENAFAYFRQFEPIDRIGHSIYIYKLTAEDVQRAATLLRP
ncbi:MAG: glycosyltransferase family 39 protein [Paludisphaera borealis]|uniref:ArnT family glycosyltransferase n=1 Tax=Paludisphaera borealis TaxID=1387353 RepID=UPI002845A069|nr:glycosyltransferase family 39 protein [Paludisphaera borealis]MDR3622086.1 glycosyltransferase family 39 protein [Paludisphaera borealis]